MQSHHPRFRRIVLASVTTLVAFLGTTTSSLAQTCDVPLFLTDAGGKPNVILAYDTSGSMKRPNDYTSREFKGNLQRYKTQFEARLAKMDRDDPLKAHMKELTGGWNRGFDDYAIYDAAEVRVCARYDRGPCRSTLSEVAKCNLGRATLEPGTCSIGGGTLSSYTPKGRGFALPYDQDPHHKSIASSQNLFQGRFLNFLHHKPNRDDIARQAVYDLVAENRGTVNWGLMSFSFYQRGEDIDPAGMVISPIDPDDSAEGADDVLDALRRYSADLDWTPPFNGLPSSDQEGLIINSYLETPLARLLDDSYRYFRGERLHLGQRYPSPVQESCQDNVTLLITDGGPTDGDLSEDEVVAACGKRYSDQRREGQDDEDWALDDLAACLHDAGDVAPRLFGDQPLTVHTIGFTTNYNSQANILADTAEAGGGQYYHADSGVELAEALSAATSSIATGTASGTRASIISSDTPNGDRVLRASFKPAHWLGRVQALALPFPEDGSDPEVVWDAADALEARTAASRRIYAVVEDPAEIDACPEAGCAERVDDVVELTEGRLDAFYDHAGGVDLFEIGLDKDRTNLARDIVDWTRGRDLGSSYRTRDPDGDAKANGVGVSKMQDIIDGSPVVVGPPPNVYNDPSYQVFAAAHQERLEVVYVAHQAGGISALDAATGEELWFLIPNFNLPLLDDLMDANYCHLNTMNATPLVRDVYIRGDEMTVASADWRTVLIVGSGSVGGAYLALDITDPGTAENPNPPTVLWQWPNPEDFGVPSVLAAIDPSNPSARFGEMRSRPAVGFAYVNGNESFPGDPNDDRWRTWIGSGPQDEGDGKARVAELRLFDGTLMDLVTPNPAAESDNWSTDVTPLAVGGGLVTDAIYWGTDEGRLWRVTRDLPGSTEERTQLVHDAGRPMSARPIASFVSATVGDDEVHLFYGTGRYETVADKDDFSVQRIYGVRDRAKVVKAGGRTQPLVSSTDLVDRTDGGDGGLTEDGWFVELKLDHEGEPGSGNAATGVRSVNELVLLNGTLFATVFEPDTEACSGGGSGFLLAFDSDTGGATSSPVMDIDGDGEVDEADFGRGIWLGQGLPAKPVLDAGRGALVIQSSDTSIHITAIELDPFPVVPVRWRVQ